MESDPRPARSESAERSHTLNRSLDALPSAHYACDLTIAQDHGHELVDSFPPLSRIVRVFLRLPSSDDLSMIRQVLRRARDREGRIQASVHHRRNDRLDIDVSSGADIHRRFDSLAWRKALAKSAPTGIR